MSIGIAVPKGVLLMDASHLSWLRQIATALCSGSDVMRDQGNALWLVIWEIEGINNLAAQEACNEEQE
jgi:hypothetical protein